MEPPVDSVVPKSSRAVKDFVAAALGGQGTITSASASFYIGGGASRERPQIIVVMSPPLLTPASLSRKKDAQPPAPQMILND